MALLCKDIANKEIQEWANVSDVDNVMKIALCIKTDRRKKGTYAFSAACEAVLETIESMNLLIGILDTSASVYNSSSYFSFEKCYDYAAFESLKAKLAVLKQQLELAYML